MRTDNLQADYKFPHSSKLQTMHNIDEMMNRDIKELATHFI